MFKLETYEYNGKIYKVEITRKRMKYIRYRFSNNTFKISAPYMTSISSIKKGLDKFAPRFINNQKPASEGKNYIYIFGYMHPFAESGEIKFSSGQTFHYKDRNDFDKKMKKFLLDVLTDRVRYFENRMMLPEHKVRVRNMETRYGSNSKYTHTVCFAFKLYHFSIDILDSIVVHELSHSVVFDHSKAFYDVVYKYCPSYESLHKKLRNGEFLWLM